MPASPRHLWAGEGLHSHPAHGSGGRVSIEDLYVHTVPGPRSAQKPQLLAVPIALMALLRTHCSRQKTGPPDHPRHSGRSGDWGSGLSLTPLTSRCLCSGLTVCEKPRPRTRVPAACVRPPCSLGSPASWPVCPPRPGLTLLTLQRAVYLCMAVPRQAGVGAGGLGAHRGEGFAVGERQGDVKQGPGRAFREAGERPGHMAWGGSAVLQPGEPGRSWGSGRSSRRRALEGLAGRCAEGECSRLRGAS